MRPPLLRVGDAILWLSPHGVFRIPHTLIEPELRKTVNMQPISGSALRFYFLSLDHEKSRRNDQSGPTKCVYIW